MTPPPNRSWVPSHGYQEHHPAPIPPPFRGVWAPGPPPGVLVHPAFAIPPLPPPPPYTANPTTPASGSAPPGAPIANGSTPAPAPAAPAPAPLPGAQLTGGLMSGASYIYPSTHTNLHVIHPLARPPWEGEPQTIKFTITKVPTMMSIKDVIQRVLGDGDAHKVTEVLEVGEGKWFPGKGFSAGELGAGKSCGVVGWDESRGEGGRRPVWVYFERG
ncbi:MAG: hypothetical protein M1836_000006 [Candelina mexicana]|nr:MAG: hypothetical protein M1836_000006 [Candelina mexicana]